MSQALFLILVVFLCVFFYAIGVVVGRAEFGVVKSKKANKAS